MLLSLNANLLCSLESGDLSSPHPPSPSSSVRLASLSPLAVSPSPPPQSFSSQCSCPSSDLELCTSQAQGILAWRILTLSCSEHVLSPYLCRWPSPAPRPSLQPLELRASVILLLCEGASPLQRGGKPASEQPWTKGLRCPIKLQAPRFETRG